MKKTIIYILVFIFIGLAGLFVLRKSFSENLYIKGKEAYSKNELGRAESYYKKSLICYGSNIYPVIGLIRIKLSQQELSKAYGYIEKALAIDKKKGIVLNLKAQALIQQKKYKEAINFLNLSIKSDSLLAEAYYFRGIAKGNIGDLEGAAEDYLKAQELDKSNLEALEQGALLLSELSHYGDAIENYNKLLELDPTNIGAFKKRAEFKLKIEDFAGASKDFESILNLDPTNSEVYYKKGLADAKSKQLNKAIESFKEAIKLKHKAANAEYNIGMAYFKLNDHGKASKHLNNCIDIKENNEYVDKAYELLGVIYLMKPDFKGAAKYFDKCLKLNPNSTNAYFNQAIAYENMKLHNEAIENLNKCIELGKKTADVYFARGVQKISINNFTDGCKDIDKASSMGHPKAKEMITTYCN